jgi:hypothetical protein
MKLAILLLSAICIRAAAQIQALPIQRPGFPTQAQSTGNASLEGTVLDAMTREPVKKASVLLLGTFGLDAVTDASGHFAFRQLPAGRWGVQANSERYPPTQDALDNERQVWFSLAADEQKQDVMVLLTPGASVRGRIVDEDGNPMSGCNVLAMHFVETGVGRTPQQAGNSQSNDKGEYRISNVPRGKYYIQAHCFKTIPLPHPFVRRGSTVDLPSLTYAAVFYPNSPDPASAAKVQAASGADVSGIDFRMTPARGITVRGHAGPATDRNIAITLQSKDPSEQNWGMHGARFNAGTGEFQVQNVLPGSYELVAISNDEGRFYFAKVPVEVGSEPLEPIDLTLAPAPSVSGSISIEGDRPQASVHLGLNPVDPRPMRGAQPQAEVQPDGTFTLNSVMPGHWRLNVGLPGIYLKSVKQGDQDVTPWDIETGSSPVQLKVVLGTKFAQIEASLSGAQPADSASISGFLWTENGDPQYQQNIGLTPQTPAKVSVPPGKYHVCAVAVAQPWMLMQNHALRKALESHCETVEASEGETARVQIPVIPAADLKQLLDKIEE